MITSSNRHQLCHVANQAKTYNISRWNLRPAFSTPRSSCLGAHTLPNPSSPCFHTQSHISQGPWTRWSCSFGIYELHSWWSSRPTNANVHWWSCLEPKDFSAVKWMGIVREAMRPKAVFCPWRTVFYPSHPHSWRDHYIWHYSRTCDLRALCRIPTWIGCESWLQIQPWSHNWGRSASFFQIPLTNPYPGPRSVLILDNCSIHHSEKVRALVEDDVRKYLAPSLSHLSIGIHPDNPVDDGLPECKLIFLPPYSPDLNPIEQAFASIKAFLRCNWQDFSLSVIDHVCQNITADKAHGFFRALGYVV